MSHILVFLCGAVIGVAIMAFMRGQDNNCEECEFRYVEKETAASEVYVKESYRELEALPLHEPMRTRFHKHTKNRK